MRPSLQTRIAINTPTAHKSLTGELRNQMQSACRHRKAPSITPYFPGNENISLGRVGWLGHFFRRAKERLRLFFTTSEESICYLSDEFFFSRSAAALTPYTAFSVTPCALAIAFALAWARSPVTLSFYPAMGVGCIELLSFLFE